MALPELLAFLLHLQRQREDAVFLLRQLFLERVDGQLDGAAVEFQQQLVGLHLLAQLGAPWPRRASGPARHQFLMHRTTMPDALMVLAIFRRAR
jgi:hypothetical protein